MAVWSCRTLFWNMAIFPYQDDLRTDQFSGCSGFPGGTCGIFTSITGTAPNRQFNIEWRAVHFADTTAPANFQWCSTRTNQASLTSSMAQRPTAALMKPAACKQLQRSGDYVLVRHGHADGRLESHLHLRGRRRARRQRQRQQVHRVAAQSLGASTPSDPTQTDRLFRSGIPQTCPASTTCAIFGDGLPRHYDSYTFTNTTGATQCVTVDTNTACTGANFIFTGAYLGSFDPSNICTNWIGDSGFSPNPDQPFQFNVDDGQTFVVVVSEVTPDSGCPGYTVTITPDTICGGGGRLRQRLRLRLHAQREAVRRGHGLQANPYPLQRCALWLCPDCHPLLCVRWSRRRHSTTAVNRMNLATGTWEPRASMPFASEAPTCALMEAPASFTAQKVIRGSGFASYNIATNTWTPLANTPNGG